MSSASTSASTTPDSTRTAAGSSAMASFSASLRTQYAHAASWENVTYSAMVLGAVNLIFLLMWSLNVPALALINYCLAATVLLSFPYTQFFLKSKTDDNKKEVIPEKQFMDWAKDMYVSVNSSASYIRSILYWVDKQRSFFATAFLLATGWVCTYVSLSVLVALALNCALVSRPLRQLYDRHLAKTVEPHVRQITNQVEAVVSKIPMLTDKIVEAKSKKI